MGRFISILIAGYLLLSASAARCDQLVEFGARFDVRPAFEISHLEGDPNAPALRVGHPTILGA